MFASTSGSSRVESPAGRGDGPAPIAAPVDGLIGRDDELRTLLDSYAQAGSGARQVVFVTGEAGAGKTTLVEALLATLEASGEDFLVAHGHCIEGWGRQEPYRPLLEALQRLLRHDGEGVSAVLQRHAPTWLRRLSQGDVPEGDPGSELTPARMLREITVALEELGARRTLVLILEDVHWADLETADVCNLLARRRDPARLLLVVTMRRADAMVVGQPLDATRGDLVLRGAARELGLHSFDADAVHRYLLSRCPALVVDQALPAWIQHQTSGNPLFVRIVIDDLIEREVLRRDAGDHWQAHGTLAELRDVVPDNLRVLVERQIERLDARERDVVEAACVLPREIEPVAVARFTGLEEEAVEEICTALARRGQMLRRMDAGASRRGGDDRYTFVHSLVQRILHERLPTARRRRFHRAAAQWLAERRPDGGSSTSVQLALHCVMADEPAEALAHLQQAAASVQQIPAPREVTVIRERILELIERNPDMPGHRRERIRAMMELIHARQFEFGGVDEENVALCQRVLELAVAGEDDRERFLATLGLFWGNYYAGRYRAAHTIASGLLEAARSIGHPVMLQTMEFSMGSLCYRMGEFDRSQEHLDACLRHGPPTMKTFGWNFPSMAMSHRALIAWHGGRPDEARDFLLGADRCGRREDGTHDGSVIPLIAYAWALLQENGQARTWVDRSLALADRAGAAAWIERARFLDGLLTARAGAVAEGIRGMQESLVRQLRDRVCLERSAYCALLAGEMIGHGVDGAETVIDEGFRFQEASGEAHFAAELHRLRALLERGR